MKKHLKTQDQFESVYSSILNELAKNIIVKESRWTWVREQKERLKYSNKFLADMEHETVGDFLDEYNEFIDVLVLFSNLGHSKISQPPSEL